MKVSTSIRLPGGIIHVKEQHLPVITLGVYKQLQYTYWQLDFEDLKTLGKTKQSKTKNKQG